jgi:hypothetical protein
VAYSVSFAFWSHYSDAIELELCSLGPPLRFVVARLATADETIRGDERSECDMSGPAHSHSLRSFCLETPFLTAAGQGASLICLLSTSRDWHKRRVDKQLLTGR